jgi:hypothetical protein
MLAQAQLAKETVVMRKAGFAGTACTGAAGRTGRRA